MKAFLEYIARSLVDHPDAVEVDVEEGEGEVTLTLVVDERDMGRVIGRDGRTANGSLVGDDVELDMAAHE